MQIIKKSDDTLIQLLYSRHTDLLHLKGDITFHLCTAVNRVVSWQALGAQKLRGVWLIGVKSPEAKATLLHTHLLIEGREVMLYGENPYTMAQARSNYERVIIRGFPFWEPNTMITKFVRTMPQLDPTSDHVYFSKARNNLTKGNSSFMNGDRFIFVKPEIDPPLLEKVMIGSYECRVWYASRDLRCKRCGEAHNTNDTQRCDYYTPPLEDVIVFNSGPFSNFHRCDVNLGPLTFPTSEHAYQFRACEEHLRADLAEQVLKAKYPRIASQIKDQDPTSNWNLIKYDVMREVLMAKINTNPDIKSYLYESGDKQLVEASANDLYWGSGLPFNITVTTTPDKYPGKNMLGKLLCDIRSELRANDIISDNPTPASQGTAVTVPSHKFLETPIHAQPSEATGNSSVCEAVSPRNVTPKPRSSHSIALKSSRRSTTPLIRDVFKQDAKRKRVKSPQAFTSADSMHVSDDSLSVSSIGSFVDSSDKILADFCDDHCESTCKS